jgi:hypothetical protein
MNKFTSLRIYGSSKVSDPTRRLGYYNIAEKRIVYDDYKELTILKRSLLTYIPPGVSLPLIHYTKYQSSPSTMNTGPPSKPFVNSLRFTGRLPSSSEKPRPMGFSQFTSPSPLTWRALSYNDTLNTAAQKIVYDYYTGHQCREIPTVSSCKYQSDTNQLLILLSDARVCLRQFVNSQSRHSKDGGFACLLDLSRKTIDIKCEHGKCTEIVNALCRYSREGSETPEYKSTRTSVMDENALQKIASCLPNNI